MRPNRGAAWPKRPRREAATTYRLVLEYDGTRYSGWQEQVNAPRTVAGTLRRVVEEAGVAVVDLGGSGRTDAGVHALAQVAHLRVGERRRDPEAFRRAINAALPADVHVLALAEAPRRFHARHDAVARTYLYQISRRRTAFAKRFVWWVRDELDVARMREAAVLVSGRHNFRLYCEEPEQQTSTLVEVEGVELAEAGSLVVVRVTASHFLWKMARRIVGTLVEVGAGRLSFAGFADLLAARPLPPGTGSPAQWTAPASGLFLERVTYRGDPPLPPMAPATPVGAEPAGRRARRGE